MPDDADVGTGAELWSYMAEDHHGVDRYFLPFYSLCAGSLSNLILASTRDGSASGTPSPASSAPPSPHSQSTEQHPPP